MTFLFPFFLGELPTNQPGCVLHAWISSKLFMHLALLDAWRPSWILSIVPGGVQHEYLQLLVDASAFSLNNCLRACIVLHPVWILSTIIVPLHIWILSCDWVLRQYRQSFLSASCIHAAWMYSGWRYCQMFLHESIMHPAWMYYGWRYCQLFLSPSCHPAWRHCQMFLSPSCIQPGCTLNEDIFKCSSVH